MAAEKKVSFGACNIGKYSPSKNNISSDTKILNLHISFEDALKLNLAIDECLRKLNKYKRSTTAGKKSALNLAIHLNKDKIAVVEGKI